MDFFISNAWAEAAGQPAEPGFMAFVPLVVLFVVFYFLLIRPQSKRVKEHKTMVESIKKGDEIITNGGVLAKVMAVEEEFVSIELAENMAVCIQKQAVANLVPKGTLQSAKKSLK
jgi:preprotein translocase subunit YajC